MTSDGLRERKKVETACSLARAAYTLARDHGIDAVTTEAIATSAGYSRRTVANHFGGKAEAVVHGFFLEIGMPSPHLRLSSEGTPLLPAATIGQLLDAAEDGLRRVLSSPRHSELAVFARLVHDSADMKPFLLSTLRELVLSNFAPEDEDTRVTAELLLGAVVGLVTVLIDQLVDPAERCTALTSPVGERLATAIAPDVLDASLDHAFTLLRSGFAPHLDTTPTHTTRDLPCTSSPSSA